MKLKTVATIITLSIITTTITQASTQNNIIAEDTFTPCGLDETVHYDEMTTAMIQLEVEKHSQKGDLPFDLGKELIKRWTKS